MSKFETYLMDHEFTMETTEQHQEQSEERKEQEQYPEGFFTEL